MRETIERRRTALEDALQAHFPETEGFDRFREDPLTVGRPRVGGQVFLTMIDGLTAGAKPLERVRPIAVALELASLQTDVHRAAFERDDSTAGLTRHILNGDLLESKAFEVLVGYRDSPRTVRRCFEVLVRATRRVQEGHAIVYGAGTSSTDDVGRRLGALTGGGAELAGLIADADDETRRQLATHGTTFGRDVWLRTVGEQLPPETGDLISTSATDRSRAIDGLADCCPPGSRSRVRDQLHAFLETDLDYESVDTPA